MSRRDVIVLRNRGILLMLTLAVSAVGGGVRDAYHLPRRHHELRQRRFLFQAVVPERPGTPERGGLSRPRVHTGKDPGVYRIAVVGDSFTYGNGVRQEDRYSDLAASESCRRISKC